jgi:hypothetical protein
MFHKAKILDFLELKATPFKNLILIGQTDEKFIKIFVLLRRKKRSV